MAERLHGQTVMRLCILTYYNLGIMSSIHGSVYLHVDHMTNMAAKSYLQNLQNQMAYDIETGFVALGIVCSIDYLYSTLSYFTVRSDLVSGAFIWRQLMESH